MIVEHESAQRVRSRRFLTLSVSIIEVNSPEELRTAISPHTAMIVVLGNHLCSGRLRR